MGGASLVAQGLRLCAPNAEGTGSIPGGGTKILHDHNMAKKMAIFPNGFIDSLSINSLENIFEENDKSILKFI